MNASIQVAPSRQKSPIRPDLVRGIQLAISRGAIGGRFTSDDIKKPGQLNKYVPVLDVKTGRKRMKVLPGHAGEDYVINCPFCGDSRKRLYINHAWRWHAPGSPAGEYNADYLVHCFNEECEKTEPDFHRRLEALICPLVHAAYSAVSVRKTTSVVEDTGPLHVFPIPDGSPRIHETNTPAREYMLSRGYDPVLLGEDYDVRVLGRCLFGGFEEDAGGRVCFPVIMDGSLVGCPTFPRTTPPAGRFHVNIGCMSFVDDARWWPDCGIRPFDLTDFRSPFPDYLQVARTFRDLLNGHIAVDQSQGLRICHHFFGEVLGPWGSYADVSYVDDFAQVLHGFWMRRDNPCIRQIDRWRLYLAVKAWLNYGGGCRSHSSLVMSLNAYNHKIRGTVLRACRNLT